MRREAGFTLLELVVAVAIFATLALMAYQGLAATLFASARIAESQARIAALQRAVARMTRDVAAIAPRPIGLEGGKLSPSLIVSDEGRRIEFTRGGVANPMSAPRSGFRRIAYIVDEEGEADGRLVRLVWDALDRPGGASEPTGTVLLDDVSGLRVRVWTKDAGWLEEWRPELQPESAGPLRSALPVGIELTLRLPQEGIVRRVVALQ